MRKLFVLLISLIYGTAAMSKNIPDGSIAAPKIVYWASLGRDKIVRELLEKGEDPNATDDSGYSALQAAAENNHLEIVKMLIDRGVNVNYKGQFTVLELAKMAGNKEIIELLVKKGAK